jgi:hypothetical protein
MKIATVVFTFVLLFSWSGISGAESSSDSKSNQFTGESTKNRTTGAKIFGRIIGITAGAAMDAGLAVAGFSWARSGHANIYTQVFTQHAAPGLLGSRGAAGEVIKQIPGDPLGYRSAEVEGNPTIVASADVDTTLTVEPTYVGEVIGDNAGNLFLCYNDGCKQIQGAVLLVTTEEALGNGAVEISTDENVNEPKTEPIQAMETPEGPSSVQPVNTERSEPTVRPAIYSPVWNPAPQGTTQTAKIQTASAHGGPFGMAPGTANP